MDPNKAWQNVGEIGICPKAWPLFGKVANGPGLYRITLRDGRVYIGQSSNLRRRLSEYRRPTAGIEGEDVLHHELIATSGGWLAIRSGASLHDAKTRRAAEQAEIAAAKAAGVELLNPGLGNGVRTLRARMAYHERQLARLRRELEDRLTEATSSPASHSSPAAPKAMIRT